MLITFCKSKIAHGTITQAELYYEGSITVDEALLKAVDIINHKYGNSAVRVGSVA